MSAPPDGLPAEVWEAVAAATTAPISDPQFLSLGDSDSLIEIVLKAHMCIEREVSRTIEAAVPRPQYLNLERMPFSRKLHLLAALNLIPEDFFPPLHEFNKARNRLAHDLDGAVDAAAIHARMPAGIGEVLAETAGTDEAGLLILTAAKLMAMCRVGYVLAKVGSPQNSRTVSPDWWRDL